jgi:hypothetical protein
MPIKQTLTRAERNRGAQNGIPMDAPRSERRKDNDRKPMIDLDEQDRLAELELAAKEKSRHQAKLAEASVPKPKPVKAKPPKA